MSTFDRIERQRAKLPGPDKTEERLPSGQAIAVIAGLSAASWVAVLSIAMAVRAIL